MGFLTQRRLTMRCRGARRIAMRFLMATAVGLSSCTLSTLAADKETPSPRGTFIITQHYEGNWTSKLHFTKKVHPEITFTDDYPWPALFHVSPDDQWILQVQKSGSGDNISFLYHLDSRGRLRRMEQPFGELAFGYLQHAFGVPIADLYHTGIEFTGWGLHPAILRFSIHGSSAKNGGEGVSRELIYDLQKHNFSTP